MPFLSTFITSAILAVIAAFALLSAMMPPGEGSFGVAKMAPLILIVFIPVCFCLIWFPANLIVWFSLKREQKGRATVAESVFMFSGMLFIMALAFSGYRLAPQWLHKVHFHYKLEDQFGQPIPSATIRRHNDFTRAMDDTESESDARGLFQETCKPGESFTLNPRKEGYDVASLNTSGVYSEELRQKQKVVSGAHDLIVIKMWKLQGTEPLVGIGKKHKLHYTNEPVCFDLIAGTIVSNGGDLRITVTRPPGIISGRNPQWWRVKLDAIDGGLIDSDYPDEIPYFAPENGYEPSVTISSTNRFRNGGQDGFGKGFYVKSRNGQVYTKLGLNFGINRNPDDLMYIEFSGVANTNHSRHFGFYFCRRDWTGGGGRNYSFVEA